MNLGVKNWGKNWWAHFSEKWPFWRFQKFANLGSVIGHLAQKDPKNNHFFSTAVRFLNSFFSVFESFWTSILTFCPYPDSSICEWSKLGQSWKSEKVVQNWVGDFEIREKSLFLTFFCRWIWWWRSSNFGQRLANAVFPQKQTKKGHFLSDFGFGPRKIVFLAKNGFFGIFWGLKSINLRGRKWVSKLSKRVKSS